MAEKKAEKNNKVLPIILIVGALGVGGYFLYNYLTKEKEPEHPEVGFNITNYTIPASAPPGSEFTITIIAQNNLTEDIDGFCRIVDLDAQAELFYEHLVVGITEETKMHTFNFTTIMPNKDFNIRITTGLHLTGEINSTIDWTITPGLPYEAKILEADFA